MLGPLHAQEIEARKGSGPAPDYDSTAATLTISKRVNEVNLVFMVTDKKGRFVNNVPLENLQVLDNHLPPQALDYFQQQTDLPLHVALLIDTSDSIRERFKFEQQAASTFLKKILRPDRDQAMVVGFDSRVRLAQDLTGSVEALAHAVSSLKPGGETALYDAIVLAADKLRASGEAGVVRRAIILITDGMDNKSRALMFDAQQALARSETLVFALSTNNRIGEDYPKGDAVLDLLTGPTGGHILPARDRSNLKQAFQTIESALRSQYAIGYHPASFKADGGFRPIEITPLGHNLKVRCRKGYFAPREEAVMH